MVNFLTTIMQGKITYISAVAIVMHAGLSWWLGYVDTDTAIKQIVEGVGLAGLRRAISPPATTPEEVTQLPDAIGFKLDAEDEEEKIDEYMPRMKKTKDANAGLQLHLRDRGRHPTTGSVSRVGKTGPVLPREIYP